MSNYGRNFRFKTPEPTANVTYSEVSYVDERGTVGRTIKVIPGKEQTAASVLADSRVAWEKLDIPIDATLWQWVHNVAYELGPNERITGGCPLEIRVAPNGRSDAISLATSRAQLEQERERIRATGSFFG